MAMAAWLHVETVALKMMSTCHMVDELMFGSVLEILLIGTAWNHSDPTKMCQHVLMIIVGFIKRYLQLLFPQFFACFQHPNIDNGSSFKVQTMFSPFGTGASPLGRNAQCRSRGPARGAMGERSTWQFSTKCHQQWMVLVKRTHIYIRN